MPQNFACPVMNLDGAEARLRLAMERIIALRRKLTAPPLRGRARHDGRNPSFR